MLRRTSKRQRAVERYAADSRLEITLYSATDSPRLNQERASIPRRFTGGKKLFAYSLVIF
jgi:hypothetical protein